MEDPIGAMVALGAFFALLLGIPLAGAVLQLTNRKPSYGEQALDPAGSGDACIACGSTELVSPFPSVYLCVACGYEGGEGMAAFHWKQKVEQLADLTDEQRRERARKLAEDARLLLITARSHYEVASGIGAKADAISSLDRRSRARKSDLRKEASREAAEATERTVEAIGLVEEASHLVAGTERLELLHLKLSGNMDWRTEVGYGEAVIRELDRLLEGV